MIRSSIQHHERLNLLGDLRLSPAQRRIQLHVHSHWHALGGDDVLAFVQHLLRHIAGPIVLVWEPHPIHRRRKVKAFLNDHPRLHVYEFPTGAPELNPTEGL